MRSLLFAGASLVAAASASYGADAASTTSIALFAEHTSPPEHCTSTYTKWVVAKPPTNPTQASWTYISGTASVFPSGIPGPSNATNGTYHPPSPNPSATSVAPEGVSSTASSSLTQGASTSQGASPATSEPSEPLFTGGAGLTSRLPDMQVWKWNVGISMLLGTMVMWI